MSLELNLYTVDSFTKEPFKGNPAGVCFLPTNFEQLISKENEENLFKLIAREMNLSETCFVSKINQNVNNQNKQQNEENLFQLRWFTPTNEVHLCGHGTLAVAQLLFENNNLLSSSSINGSNQFKFLTKSGILIVEKENDGKLKMDFPKGDPQLLLNNNLLKNEILNNLLKTGLQLETNNNIAKEILLCKKTKKLFLVVNSLQSLLQMEANDLYLKNFNFENEELNLNVRGISVVMNKNDIHLENELNLLQKLIPNEEERNSIDIISRYFSPWNGIHEDPVNGSSHTALGVYFSKVLNKNKLIGFQASNRSGLVFMELKENSDRIYLGGYARTMMNAKMII
ncbi:hypothetical protein ABK040_010720 [Willaertia magna]